MPVLEHIEFVAGPEQDSELAETVAALGDVGVVLDVAGVGAVYDLAVTEGVNELAE